MTLKDADDFRSYDAEGIVELNKRWHALSLKKTKLLRELYSLPLKNDDARTFLHEGLMRRIGTLKATIDAVFRAIPPDISEVPAKEQIETATINIQANVFNTFGTLDNIARIWALECDVRKNSKPLRDTQIGLGRSNTNLRHSLPDKFQRYLASIDGWFEYLEDYRHALAHRIPLYIPPHMIDPKDQDAYVRLKNEWHLTLETEKRVQLDKQIAQLTHFKAFMAHDSSNSRTVFFHPQLIADFLTIEEICNQFVNAIRDR